MAIFCFKPHRLRRLAGVEIFYPTVSRAMKAMEARGLQERSFRGGVVFKPAYPLHSLSFIILGTSMKGLRFRFGFYRFSLPVTPGYKDRLHTPLKRARTAVTSHFPKGIRFLLLNSIVNYAREKGREEILFKHPITKTSGSRLADAHR